MNLVGFALKLGLELWFRIKFRISGSKSHIIFNPNF